MHTIKGFGPLAQLVEQVTLNHASLLYFIGLQGGDGSQNEVSPADPGIKVLRFSLLASTQLAKDLTNPQMDGRWARIPVRW